jgi:hypothetical protein
MTTPATYIGICYCKATKYTVTLPAPLTATNGCSCSFCRMTGILEIPGLKDGDVKYEREGPITTYEFGNKALRFDVCLFLCSAMHGRGVYGARRGGVEDIVLVRFLRSQLMHDTCSRESLSLKIYVRDLASSQALQCPMLRLRDNSSAPTAATRSGLQVETTTASSLLSMSVRPDAPRHLLFADLKQQSRLLTVIEPWSVLHQS